MPRVKGVYENGVIHPVKKIKLEDKAEVEIIYGEISRKKLRNRPRIVTIKAGEVTPLIGIISVGGDAVNDAERYDE